MYMFEVSQSVGSFFFSIVPTVTVRGVPREHPQILTTCQHPQRKLCWALLWGSGILLNNHMHPTKCSQITRHCFALGFSLGEVKQFCFCSIPPRKPETFSACFPLSVSLLSTAPVEFICFDPVSVPSFCHSLSWVRFSDCEFTPCRSASWPADMLLCHCSNLSIAP